MNYSLWCWRRVNASPTSMIVRLALVTYDRHGYETAIQWASE